MAAEERRDLMYLILKIHIYMSDMKRCKRSDGTESRYEYDDNGNLTKLVNTGSGRPLSMYEYQYDKADRITREKENRGGNIRTTEFTYDKGGQLKSYRSIEGRTESRTTYSYDAAGNRKAVSSSGKGRVTASYNKDGQIISEKNQRTGDEIRYIYDKNGNLKEKRSNGKNRIYDYDIENRLRSVSEGGQMLMAATYDGEGNKVFQMSRKFVRREGKSGYSCKGGKSKTSGKSKGKKENGSYFDPDIFMYGAMQGGIKMSGSGSPGMIAVMGRELAESWSGIRTFFTGRFKSGKAEKKRLKELEDIVVPGTERGTLVTYDITYYLNDTVKNKDSEVMYQYGSKGREKASYIYGEEGERISGDLTDLGTKYIDDKAGNYTYIYDGQGNTVQDAREGKAVNNYSYDPYGQVLSGTEANDVIFGYNGEEYTEAAGLQYLRNRNYDAGTGRFLSRDTYPGSPYSPISQNRYAYAENDPVNKNDPGGNRSRRKGVTRWLRGAMGSIASALGKRKKHGRSKAARSKGSSILGRIGGAASSILNGFGHSVRAVKNRVTRSIRGAAAAARYVTRSLKEKVNSLKKRISCGAKKVKKAADTIRKDIRKGGIEGYSQAAYHLSLIHI